MLRRNGPIPQICRMVRERIESGELPAGTRLPTTREMAREYGVSLVTMSRAVNQLKQERLISAASGSGIFVQPLPGKRSGNHFTVFVDNWRITRNSSEESSGQYFAHLFDDMILGIQERCREHKIELELRFIPEDFYASPERIADFLHCYTGKATGVLAVNMDSFPLIREALPDIPLVFLHAGAYQVEHLHCNMILPDFYMTAFQAVSYLAESGCRRIACISGKELSGAYRLRENGYRDALAAHGFPPEGALVFPCGENLIEISECAERILALPPAERPDALFCLNDLRAIVMLEFFRRNGVQVPDEIAIMGFDGSAAALRRSISTAPQPFRAMGERGVETLLMLQRNPGLAPLFQMMIHPLFKGSTTRPADDEIK